MLGQHHPKNDPRVINAEVFSDIGLLITLFLFLQHLGEELWLLGQEIIHSLLVLF